MTGPDENDDARLLPRQFWRQTLWAVLIVPATVLIWTVVAGVIFFRTLYPWWYLLLWTVGTAAVTVMVRARLHHRRRQRRRFQIGAACAGACAVLFVGTLGWRYLTVSRFHQVCDEVYWYNYRPFTPNSRAVKVEAAPGFRISGEPPRVSAAHAMYPLCAGVAQALYPPRDYDDGELTAHSPDSIYEMLLNGKVDAIFGPPPTEAQLAAAKERGLTYKVTPFARDAFVFFVNRRNPVTGLSSAQIHDIYSGRITRWEALGAGSSGAIRPFQHRSGHCCQTMMESVMGGVPLMPPLREDRQSGMGRTVSDVADYRNYRGALGYSFRFFVNGVSRNDDIRLLALDGVAPTRENIRSGNYPLTTDCCVITVRPRDVNIRKIMSFLRSPAGSELIEKTGYIPLAPPADAKAVSAQAAR